MANKALTKLLSGSADANIRFEDVRKILLGFGFAERVKGDHHIFTKDDVAEILNLQPRQAMAKPYQVKQVRKVIVVHKLAGDLE